jgi:SagB-type dehydrogenase family enzyme
MRRIDLDYVVISMLLLSGLYVFVTGLLANWMGLNRFAFHPLVGYIFAALAFFHVLLHWPRIVAFVQYRLQSSHPRHKARAQRDSGGGVTRRDVLFAALGAAGGFGLAQFFLPLGGEGKRVEGDLGQLYHQWSSFGMTLFSGGRINWGSRPSQYKRYPDAKRVSLPSPVWEEGPPIGELIERRRSVRHYVDQPLSKLELSRLLHAMQGITEDRRGFRAAPSAGALYPIEVYAVIQDVEGVESGVYHYAVREHALEQIKKGDYSDQVTAAGAMQTFLGEAQVVFILTAVFQRTRWKYRERTYRYVLLEAGHIAQNLYLAATALDLGCCAVGAFRDQALDEVVGVDGDEGEEALYLLPVGKVG